MCNLVNKFVIILKNQKAVKVIMQFLEYKTIIGFMIILSSFSLSAQFPGGSRDTGGGLISVVAPGKAGRIVTVGGRLSPVVKIGHSIPVSGYIQKINVTVGDKVTTKQPLIQISRDIIGETFLPVVLESRINGIVSEIHVYEKQEVSSGTLAVTILDNTSFLLITTVSDRDALAVRRMGIVSVTGVTPEGRSFKGSIEQISQEPDYDTGLFTLTMKFPQTTGLFMGMVLFVDLAAQKAQGITIEKSGVIMDGEKSYVWTLNKEEKLTKKEIITSKEIESNIVVVKGLKAGDKYVNRVSGKEEEGLSLKDLGRLELGKNGSGRGN